MLKKTNGAGRAYQRAELNDIQVRFLKCFFSEPRVI